MKKKHEAFESDLAAHQVGWRPFWILFSRAVDMDPYSFALRDPNPGEKNSEITTDYAKKLVIIVI